MRKPDYQRGPVTLYCGDCRDLLPQIEGINAVVTDPPYGISLPCNFRTRGRGALATCKDYPDVAGDDKDFDPSHLLAIGCPAILWGGNYYASRLPDSSGWLVWDKQRPDDLDQSTCELAWTNCVKGVRRFAHLWNGCMRASEKGMAYHPTQKPVALFTWSLMLRWTKGFKSICDPYMGSGPCGIAAVRTGRRFIGIEIDPKYFDIAVRRVDAELRQGQFSFPATAQSE